MNAAVVERVGEWRLTAARHLTGDGQVVRFDVEYAGELVGVELTLSEAVRLIDESAGDRDLVNRARTLMAGMLGRLPPREQTLTEVERMP